MAIKIILGLGIIVGLFLIYVAMQPEIYMVSRSVTINAPAEKIFPYLNNSRLIKQWSDWSEIDPQAKMAFDGPETGVGAKTSWQDGKQLGTGSATIVNSIPNQQVDIKLSYVKPMVMEQDATYLLTSQGNQSVMTWKVTGKNGFMGRLMCVFMNMDKMVGGMFEKFLGNLKTIVEKSA
jgi:hypothetical protein